MKKTTAKKEPGRELKKGRARGAGAHKPRTHRRRTEQALRRSKQYAASIIDSSLDMIIAVDNHRQIVEFNPAAQKTFGYRRAEVLGEHIDLLYADPAEGHELHRATFEHGKNTREVLNRRKNGEIFTSQVSAATLRDSKGELLGVVGISRDITQAKHVEEARRQAEERYRTIFENAVEGIFQSTLEGRFISVNPALARMWGYASPQDLIASITNIAEQLYLERTRRAEFERLMDERGEVHGFEFQVRRKDGSLMWVSENARAVRDAAGGLLYYEGTTEDITARKQAEEALLKFRLGIERSSEAIFLTDSNGTMTYVNPAFEKIYGYSKEEALGKTPRLLKSGLIRDKAYEDFWNQLLSKQVVTGEITNRTKDGEFITMESSANPILNAAGEIVGFLAIQRDITERKRGQAEMLLEKARFQQLFENSPIGIAMLDAQDRIQTINPAFQTIFQYTPEEVVGRFINAVIIPSAYQEEAVRLSSLAMNGAASQTETVRMRKDGTLVPVQVYGVPIVRDGKAMGIYGMYADITQAKQMESQLKREVEKLSALHQIDRALSTLDLHACLQIIVTEARALFASDLVAILLSEGDHLRLAGEVGLVSTLKEIVVPFGSGISGWCGARCQSLLVPDVSQDARYLLYDSRTRAEMAAPLSVQGVCIGVLNVESSQVNAFTPADLELLESLAARAAAAIHNARLHAAEREHRQFAETLRDVGIALTSQLDPGAVLDQLLDLVGSVVPYDSAAVLLLEGKVVRCKRQRGYDQLGLAEWMQEFEVPLNELASLSKIVESGRPYIVSDTYTDPNWTVIAKSRHIRSWIGAPIHIRGTLIGFLALDKLEPGFYTDPMADRLVAFASQAGMAMDNARLYAEQQQLAVTDSMTGLSNRRHFVEVAQRELVRASRMRSPFAVVMIDLNDFKKVNDTFGHSAGDQALQLVAKLLASHVRAVDLVARYGGDEFVMLLPDCNPRAAQNIATRLQEDVRALRLAMPNGSIELDFSVGVAISTLAPEETLDSLLVRADAAMYEVKQQSKALVSAA